MMGGGEGKRRGREGMGRGEEKVTPPLP